MSRTKTPCGIEFHKGFSLFLKLNSRYPFPFQNCLLNCVLFQTSQTRASLSAGRTLLQMHLFAGRASAERERGMIF